MLHDLKNCLIVRLSKDVFSLPHVRKRLCTSVIMRRGGGSRGRSWVIWAALARRRRRMVRQTSTCSHVSLQIMGMDPWLGQDGAAPGWIHHSVPPPRLAACFTLQYNGILLNNWFIKRQTPAVLSVPESLWYPWAHPCKAAGCGIHAGWTRTRRDVGMQEPQSKGIPPALTVEPWGCPARSLYPSRLLKRIKPLCFCWFSCPLWVQK